MHSSSAIEFATMTIGIKRIVKAVFFTPGASSSKSSLLLLLVVVILVLLPLEAAGHLLLLRHEALGAVAVQVAARRAVLEPDDGAVRHRTLAPGALHDRSARPTPVCLGESAAGQDNSSLVLCILAPVLLLAAILLCSAAPSAATQSLENRSLALCNVFKYQ